MDDGEAGACAICYALHLPDPARPDELGEGAQLLVLTACVVLTGVLVLEQVHCIGQCAITRWSLTWLLFYNVFYTCPFNRPMHVCLHSLLLYAKECSACLLRQLAPDSNRRTSLPL
jgi:hypothetical protein